MTSRCRGARDKKSMSIAAPIISGLAPLILGHAWDALDLTLLASLQLQIHPKVTKTGHSPALRTERRPQVTRSAAGASACAVF